MIFMKLKDCMFRILNIRQHKTTRDFENERIKFKTNININQTLFPLLPLTAVFYYTNE